MIIDKELAVLQKKLYESFFDPIPQETLKKFVSKGSKFVRSSFAILYLKSQNIEINNDIYKILCAGELIHNASLLHDDVIDEAETRRGEATLARKFTSKFSILAGDYLLSGAIEKLLELNNLKILNIFKDCTKEMTIGEINQFFARNQYPLKDDYINFCKGKTASLFAAILESCALISNISREKARFLGEIFGVCFQINNDLNSVSELQDKINGIYTAKDIVGIENTKILLDNYKEEMNKLVNGFPENIYKESLKDLINSL